MNCGCCQWGCKSRAKVWRESVVQSAPAPVAGKVRAFDQEPVDVSEGDEAVGLDRFSLALDMGRTKRLDPGCE